ncbi:UPF0157 protein [Colletotrichum chlorophyti]|uniref:UPF0157 protein n=1 Tax=Colletotrichum chlorophyti TaxID=708187 RepID=A0A1Q8S0N5_9PEZI|nr:UPF0157 protein [Colletotrichum chlorophyti]
MTEERGEPTVRGVPQGERGLRVAIFFVTVSGRIANIATNILTLPYYRFYQQNTLLPILTIAKSVEDRESDGEISAQLKRWRDRKLSEFQLVQVASTLISAAVIGCFSWPAPDSLHWLSPAFWHASISLSLFSILLAASEQFIFQTLHRSPRPRNVDKDLAMILYIRRSRNVEPVHSPLEEVPPIPQIREIKIKEKGGWLPKEMPLVEVRWNMIFTWQAPMMLMAYSALFFLGGLTVYVCAPLYDGQGWVGESKAAVFYLVSFFFCGITFIWCAFWAYRLPAKAVIDIDLTVPDPSVEDDYVPALESVGFQFISREPEWHEHRFFAMCEPYHCNLHVFKPGTAELVRHVIMKEWLIEHDDDRELYARTKVGAADVSNSLGETVMEYNFRKETVIREILERAFRAKGYMA